MNIASAKTVAAELFAKGELRPDPTGGDDYYHLEIADWLKLDTIKHDLARDVSNLVFTDQYEDEGAYVYSFDAGEGLARVDLAVDFKRKTVYAFIVLEGDPSRFTNDEYKGDEQQAWALFNALPEDVRNDLLQTLRDYGVADAPAFVSMVGDLAPEVGPNPFERAAVTPRVDSDGMTPVFYKL